MLKYVFKNRQWELINALWYILFNDPKYKFIEQSETEIQRPLLILRARLTTLEYLIQSADRFARTRETEFYKLVNIIPLPISNVDYIEKGQVSSQRVEQARLKFSIASSTINGDRETSEFITSINDLFKALIRRYTGDAAKALLEFIESVYNPYTTDLRRFFDFNIPNVYDTFTYRNYILFLAESSLESDLVTTNISNITLTPMASSFLTSYQAKYIESIDYAKILGIDQLGKFIETVEANKAMLVDKYSVLEQTLSDGGLPVEKRELIKRNLDTIGFEIDQWTNLLKESNDSLMVLKNKEVILRNNFRNGFAKDAYKIIADSNVLSEMRSLISKYAIRYGSSGDGVIKNLLRKTLASVSQAVEQVANQVQSGAIPVSVVPESVDLDMDPLGSQIVNNNQSSDDQGQFQPPLSLNEVSTILNAGVQNIKPEQIEIDYISLTEELFDILRNVELDGIANVRNAIVNSTSKDKPILDIIQDGLEKFFSSDENIRLYQEYKNSNPLTIPDTILADLVAIDQNYDYSLGISGKELFPYITKILPKYITVMKAVFSGAGAKPDDLIEFKKNSESKKQKLKISKKTKTQSKFGSVKDRQRNADQTIRRDIKDLVSK